MREGLYAIVGSAGCGALEADFCLEDAAPFAVVMPACESEVCALMEYTYAMHTSCVVAGSGMFLTHLTPPDRAWWLLSTRRLNRVIDYSPHDLVLTVGAGITLQAVQDLLREHQQYLPWNPALPEQATVGGIVASNRAGSWRYRFGTPRDRMLAVRAVTPDGIAFKSGAKVVKSVAGYDLHRLLCGSWGTLAVITEITLKVHPLPQQFEAVGWHTHWEALEPTLADLMQMPIQPDGLAVLAGHNWSAEANERPLLALHELPCHCPDERSSTRTSETCASRSFSTPLYVTSARRREEIYARATTLEVSPTIAPLAQYTPRTEPLLHAESDSIQPYLLLEFSGRPEGVAWQIRQLRERGYPAEPVPCATLQRVRDWLAPRRHALLLQFLVRPSEIAEALARWCELPGISAVAHAGNGVLYVAVDERGLTETLLQRIRLLSTKYRVLNGSAWLRRRSSGELPQFALSEGELRLMHRIKATFDRRSILPKIVDSRNT